MDDKLLKILFNLSMEALILNNLHGANDKEKLDRVDELQEEAEQLYEELTGKKFIYVPKPPKKRRRRKK